MPYQLDFREYEYADAQGNRTFVPLAVVGYWGWLGMLDGLKCLGIVEPQADNPWVVEE